MQYSQTLQGHAYTVFRFISCFDVIATPIMMLFSHTVDSILYEKNVFQHNLKSKMAANITGAI